MSTTMKRRVIAAGAATLVMAAGAAGSASAVTGGGSVSGSASVFVPAALKPHELCVSSNTTGRKCKDVPGTPAVTLTARFQANAAATAPAATVARCAGGGVVTIPARGGTLSGSATVSGLFLRARTLQFGPTAPGDAVTVSFCNKA